MRTPVAILLLVFSALNSTALADPAAPAAKAPTAQVVDGSGRFTMTPAEGGFLRLDTRNGGVSFCSVSGGMAQCRSSADERAALEAEIGRLTGENAKLKAGTSGPAASTGSQASNAMPPSGLPSDADIDRALGLLERIVRGTVRIMKEVDTEPK